jgi:hypothetical protein
VCPHLPVQLGVPLRVTPVQVVVEDVAREVVREQPLGAHGHEREVPQPGEAVRGAVGADDVAQHRLGGLPHVREHLEGLAVRRVRHVGDEALQQRGHEVGDLVRGEVVRDVAGLAGSAGALGEDVGDQRERQRVAVGEPQRGGGRGVRDPAGPQVRGDVVRVEVAQGDLAQLLLPAGVGAPGVGRRQPAAEDDDRPGRHRRQDLGAEAVVERGEQLGGVEEHHPVRSGGLVHGLGQALRGEVERADVEQHRCPAGGQRLTGEAAEERGLADAAGAVQPEHAERRVRGERLPEQLDLRGPAHERAGSGRGEPVSQRGGHLPRVDPRQAPVAGRQARAGRRPHLREHRPAGAR